MRSVLVLWLLISTIHQGIAQSAVSFDMNKIDLQNTAWVYYEQIRSSIYKGVMNRTLSSFTSKKLKTQYSLQSLVEKMLFEEVVQIPYHGNYGVAIKAQQ